MTETTQPECGWVDSMGKDDCPEPPIDSILLRDRLVAGRVLVCVKHKAEYNRTAAAARVARRDSQGSTVPHPPSMRRV